MTTLTSAPASSCPPPRRHFCPAPLVSAPMPTLLSAFRPCLSVSVSAPTPLPASPRIRSRTDTPVRHRHTPPCFPHPRAPLQITIICRRSYLCGAPCYPVLHRYSHCDHVNHNRHRDCVSSCLTGDRITRPIPRRSSLCWRDGSRFKVSQRVSIWFMVSLKFTVYGFTGLRVIGSRVPVSAQVTGCVVGVTGPGFCTVYRLWVTGPGSARFTGCGSQVPVSFRLSSMFLLLLLSLGLPSSGSCPVPSPSFELLSSF